MRRPALSISVVMLTLAITRGALADETADAFRSYVAAIRAGSVDDALKFVEPVPESCRTLLRECIEAAVAVEKVKTEMSAQMGPPKHHVEGWNIGQHSDDVLKTLQGIVDGDTARLVAKDPANPKTDIDVGFMVRSQGKWVVAAATALAIDPPAKFVEPPQEERDAFSKLAAFTTSAAKTVLTRLQKKEFKSPVEVQDALAQELLRAGSK